MDDKVFFQIASTESARNKLKEQAKEKGFIGINPYIRYILKKHTNIDLLND